MWWIISLNFNLFYGHYLNIFTFITCEQQIPNPWVTLPAHKKFITNKSFHFLRQRQYNELTLRFSTTCCCFSIHPPPISPTLIHDVQMVIKFLWGRLMLRMWVFFLTFVVIHNRLFKTHQHHCCCQEERSVLLRVGHEQTCLCEM
jgi:hypothetical protein